MNESLREKIARALYARRWGSGEGHDWPLEAENTRRLWRDDADVALAAIEASGTHLVVPVEPTEEMLAASNREWDGRMSFRSTGAYQAMLAARPKP